MNRPSIHVDSLGKRYILGEHKPGYSTLREAVARSTKNAVTRLWPGERQTRLRGRESIWALMDVSLSIQHGEVVGIIGSNGAGKTTLLKILSRITEPSRGRVILYGRVGSLLEVGTGFHPELTGRENVYLNGAILGMERAEIARKFDEIVAFADVEQFIDTPVKRYSSGMQTRLAFSVAAHMEPEILLVDEVLAVGDLAFQKKCVGKMDEVAATGRTVVFVSHNMQAVRNLCPRTIVLDKGRVVCDAPTGKAITVYNDLMRNRRVGAETALHSPEHRRGSGSARFTDVSVVDPNSRRRFEFEMGESVLFKLAFKTMRRVPELLVSVGFRSSLSGEFVTTVRHTISDIPLASGTEGCVTIPYIQVLRLLRLLVPNRRGTDSSLRSE